MGLPYSNVSKRWERMAYSVDLDPTVDLDQAAPEGAVHCVPRPVSLITVSPVVIMQTVTDKEGIW